MEPEYASVEDFVQFCMDEDRKAFLPGEAQKVAAATHRTIRDIMAEFISYGLHVETHPVATCRGFTSNNHDLYSERNGWRHGHGIGGTSRQMISHQQPT